MNPVITAFQAVVKYLFAQGEEAISQTIELAKSQFDAITSALAQKTGQELANVASALQAMVEVEYTSIGAFCQAVEAKILASAGATIPAFLATAPTPTQTPQPSAPPTPDQITTVKALVRAGADADEAFRVVLGRNQDGTEWVPTGKPGEWAKARQLAYGMTIILSMKEEEPEALKWLHHFHDKTKEAILHTAKEAESVQDWRERLVRQYAGAVRARKANETVVAIGAQWGFDIDLHTIADKGEEGAEENGTTTVPDFLRRS
ncbi:MAG: hypothetical protein CEN89_39 [Candidatus Berkelbacteria bacterium Licking1014_7]|uniref:Uncharacterized protein n=1 Tax=Candidatus Berkelbacteria bacterium Licking1014_7 TaxID=2017147 RepID=A0A554LKV8_9BACT|nr:MAG: hypothetical protein CEN89_39 [Candidatus Berkelbacteria bacterium Licking1014_7]